MELRAWGLQLLSLLARAVNAWQTIERALSQTIYVAFFTKRCCELLQVRASP
jgi:hypothetical protein